MNENTPGSEAEAAKLRISRRGFLGVLGATAVVAGLRAPARGEEEEGAVAAAPIAGPGACRVEFKVNGKSHEIETTPDRTLLETLREDLNLTGCKAVCDRGACGSCTVLIDGVPRVSCMILAVGVAGASITTVEGLGTPEAMHPLQDAFHRHDAQQCGFCTPGLVTSMAALLAGNRKPSAEEIRIAASGHICRCGTYPRVFDAVADVAARGK